MNKKLIKFVEVFLLNVNWTKLVYKYIHYYYYWCLSYLLLKRIHTKLCQFPLATFHAAQTTLIIFPCYCFLSSVPASCCLHMLTVSAWFPSIMPISIPSSGSIFFFNPSRTCSFVPVYLMLSFLWCFWIPFSLSCLEKYWVSTGHFAQAPTNCGFRGSPSEKTRQSVSS